MGECFAHGQMRSSERGIVGSVIQMITPAREPIEREVVQQKARNILRSYKSAEQYLAQLKDEARRDRGLIATKMKVSLGR